MDDAAHWLTGWYATRLHFVTQLPDDDRIPVQAACGAWVYGSVQTDWAQRRYDKGLRKCKHCLKITAREE